MPRRLSGQLFLAFLGVTLVASLLVTLHSTRAARALFESSARKDLESLTRLLGELVRPALEAKDHSALDALCKRLGAETAARYTVILPDGRVVGESDKAPEGMDSHHGRPEIEEARRNKIGWTARPSDTLGTGQMYSALRIDGAGGAILGYVRASAPELALDKTLRAARSRTLQILALCVVAAVLLSLWFSRRISRPLALAREGAELFAKGDLTHRLNVGGTEETTALVRSLNHMAAQLQERIQTVTNQRNELETIFEGMMEGLLTLDNEGLVREINQAAAEILMIDPREVVGKPLEVVARKGDFLKFVRSLLDGKPPFEKDLEIFDLNRENRHVRLRGRPLTDSAGGSRGALVVLYDMTRLTRLERVRRDFVANVSHELRTPITALRGVAEIILEDPGLDARKRDEYIRKILKHAIRLDSLIEDLLELARIERDAENNMVERTVQPVAPLIEAAEDLCADPARDRGVRIEIDCPDAIEAPLNGQLLTQAVANLLSNAIRYSAPDSVVRVEVGEADRTLRIRVIDQGCGIAEEHIPHLFQRFYRVDKARSRELGGTGLGLAIVKHIALAHGGSVGAESKVGEGSVFTILLPMSAATE